MENSHKDYNTGSEEMQVPFRIDPEFENKIPPISEDEFKQLRENILAAGEVYEPLVVWDGVLVDGHNRWKVIRENPEVKWRTRNMDFADKWAAFEWMYKNQLGRRNLTDEQRTYMIGKMYEARKKTVGGQSGNDNAVKRSAQNGPIVSTADKKKHGVSGELAIELNIGRNTVRRAEKFTKGVDALREVNPEAADKVLNGKASITKAEVREIGRMEPDEVQETVKTILNPPSNEEKREQRKVGAKISRVSTETEEDRERMARIEAIVKDMYDPTTAPEFTIDLLVEDIELNGQIYVELLDSTLKDRSNLVTDENKPLIVAAIDKVVDNILKVRDSI